MEAYLDNSATTCVYQETADLVCDLMVNHYGNPSAMHQKGVEAEQYIRTAQETLAKISDNCSLQLFSSLKKTGVAEAEAVLGGWLEMEGKSERLPPVGLRTEKVARPKNRKAMGWSARTTKTAKPTEHKKPPVK